jgi:hypothetical protein
VTSGWQKVAVKPCTTELYWLSIDTEHGVEIPDSIEVHTVELTKYNLEEATIASAPEIEQWAFFFLYADRYEPERLRKLLPGIAFQQAI